MKIIITITGATKERAISSQAQQGHRHIHKYTRGAKVCVFEMQLCHPWDSWYALSLPLNVVAKRVSRTKTSNLLRTFDLIMHRHLHQMTGLCGDARITTTRLGRSTGYIWRCRVNTRGCGLGWSWHGLRDNWAACQDRVPTQVSRSMKRQSPAETRWLPFKTRGRSLIPCADTAYTYLYTENLVPSGNAAALSQQPGMDESSFTFTFNTKSNCSQQQRQAPSGRWVGSASRDLPATVFFLFLLLI